MRYDFEKLPDITYERRLLLKKAYKHVDDIDAFVGGMLETQTDGSTVGPVFDCMLTDQFVRAKFADRYWHEYEGSGLTEGVYGKWGGGGGGEIGWDWLGWFLWAFFQFFILYKLDSIKPVFII